MVRAKIWHGGMFELLKLISIVMTNSKEWGFKIEDPLKKGTLLAENWLVWAEIWHGGIFGVYKLISIKLKNGFTVC